MPDEAQLPEGLDILHRSAQGHLHTLIVHGDAADHHGCAVHPGAGKALSSGI